MKTFFKLDCGRRVAVDAFYFQHTYLSLLEGRPNRDLNEEIIKQATKQMRPIWGDRHTHVIPPVVDESDPLHPALPPVCFTVWLTSYEPINPGNAGSELVVVWFQGECSGQPVDQIIASRIRQLPWNKLARDFEAY